MPENDDPTLGEITDALNAMGDGDILTFANGAIASRGADGWEITLPTREEPDADQQFYNQLSAAVDEYEPGGPRGPKLTAEQAFRRMLGGA